MKYVHTIILSVTSKFTGLYYSGICLFVRIYYGLNFKSLCIIEKRECWWLANNKIAKQNTVYLKLNVYIIQWKIRYYVEVNKFEFNVQLYCESSLYRVSYSMLNVIFFIVGIPTDFRHFRNSVCTAGIFVSAAATFYMSSSSSSRSRYFWEGFE